MFDTTGMSRLAFGILVACWSLVGCRAPMPPIAERRDSSPETIARGVAPPEEIDHLRLAAEHLDRADERGAVPHLQAHLRREPDAGMVRAYLGELLLKTGRPVDARMEFERFTRDAAEQSPAAKKHLVHVHTRLMELASAMDDSFREQLHRGIGLLLLVKQWRAAPETDDAAMSERTLVQALRALTGANHERPGEPRALYYLAEVYSELNQPDAAAQWRRSIRDRRSLTANEERMIEERVDGLRLGK